MCARDDTLPLFCAKQSGVAESIFEFEQASHDDSDKGRFWIQVNTARLPGILMQLPYRLGLRHERGVVVDGDGAVFLVGMECGSLLPLLPGQLAAGLCAPFLIRFA